MRNDVFDKGASKIRRYKNTYLADNVTIVDWLESQTNLKFLGGNESKSYLEKNLGIKFKGKGVTCFCRVN
jgi:hypothetical protein